MHHIVSDGWSLRVLVRELGALYEACLAGPPVPSAGAGDPVRGLRGLAARLAPWASVLEAELAYWRARLAGAPPVLDLPLDRPRPAVMSSAARAARWRCRPALLPASQALARRQGVTLFMAVLAALPGSALPHAAAPTT